MSLGLETKLKEADILAMAIDIAVQRGILNSRSLIADSRLNYGDPWKYEHLTEKEIIHYKKKFGAQNL